MKDAVLISNGADDPALLSLAESAGNDNFAACEESQRIIARECTTSFGWIVAAGAASLSFVARPEWVGLTLHIKLVLAALAVALAITAAVLLFLAMQISDFPTRSHDPMKLYQPDFSLLAVRKAGLKKLQERIDQANKINRQRSVVLNRVRVACAVELALAALAVLVLVGSHAFAG